jgi:hypothetical protein
MNWGYNRYSKPKIIPQKITDETIPSRLDAVINNPTVSAGDKQFCESLKAGWDKYNSLTSGQYGALQKCEMRYDATAMAANEAEKAKRDEWMANFDSSKREILNICANYYAKTAYFTDLARKVIADPTFIPSEKQYNAMCGNKYAQSLLANTQESAKYEVGSLVCFRDTAKHEILYRQIDTTLPLVVIQITDDITPRKSSRMYSLMQIGCSELMLVEERHIKKFREQKIKPE